MLLFLFLQFKLYALYFIIFFLLLFLFFLFLDVVLVHIQKLDTTRRSSAVKHAWTQTVLFRERKHKLTWKERYRGLLFLELEKQKHAAVDPRSRRAKAGVLKMASTLELVLSSHSILRRSGYFVPLLNLQGTNASIRERIHPLLFYCIINSLKEVKYLTIHFKKKKEKMKYTRFNFFFFNQNCILAVYSRF